jgi:hypothetical protein
MVVLVLMESTATIVPACQDSLVQIANIKSINAIQTHAKMAPLVLKIITITFAIVHMDLWVNNV